MGLDITDSFRSLVKERAVLEGYSQADLAKLASSAILKKAAEKTPFIKAAEEVASSIEEGREFIRSQRQKYTVPGAASDSERDGIEHEVALFVKACSQRIEQLSKTVENAQNKKKGQISQQAIAHLHGVVLILSENLGDAALLFDKYRGLRSQQIASIQKRRKMQQTKQAQKLKYQSQPEDPEASSSSAKPTISQNGQMQDMAFMEQENKALFDELSSLSQQVHGTEKMMREIATLNQMLSSQVMSQARQIEQVYSDALNASMNVQHGNVQLKKAISLNSSTRLYVLVILLAASLGLLFFDWFNS